MAEFLDGVEERVQKQVLGFILSEEYLKTLVTPTKQNSNKGKQILARHFELFMLEAFVGGFTHAKEEVELSKKFFRKFADAEIQTSPTEDVVPDKVLSWYKTYAIYLAGIYSEAVLNKAESIVEESIQEGLHWKDIVKKLQSSEEFQKFSEHRLQTIAKTETTKGYNRGRLEQFKGTNGYVEAVQYSAVLDKRTTPLCKSLHGRIMDINSRLVNVYLPPNHFNCRSVIIPVTRYDDWEESSFEDVKPPKDGFDNPEWRPKK